MNHVSQTTKGIHLLSDKFGASWTCAAHALAMRVAMSDAECYARRHYTLVRILVLRHCSHHGSGTVEQSRTDHNVPSSATLLLHIPPFRLRCYNINSTYQASTNFKSAHVGLRTLHRTTQKPPQTELPASTLTRSSFPTVCWHIPIATRLDFRVFSPFRNTASALFNAYYITRPHTISCLLYTSPSPRD